MVDADLFVHALNDAFRSFQSSPFSSPSSSHVPSLAVGVAFSFVAGVAVAMAVGGTLLYSRRVHSKRRKKKHLPLTEKQWRDAFEAETGRLVDSERVLRKVHHGGVESSIRAEVWPFLLNFYDFESTFAEREAERTSRREEYEDIKARCRLLRDKIALKAGTGIEVDGRLLDTSPTVRSHDPPFYFHRGNFTDGSLPASFAEKSQDLKFFVARESEELPKWDRSPGSPLHQVDKVEQEAIGARAREEFITWQRIIRLDAVRMNAEWVPYSPSQASVTKGAACLLAMDVGLKESEHLEPCLRHHAARLVAILEAYALYDPETGYCQGMSDLLSPFVALLDEDYQAFWCFTYFMYTARRNFQLDEVGIWRQLQMVSKILKLSDPQLHKHLEDIEAADCFFIYRMVVVLMRRELSFEQTISFWEVLWADKTAVRLGKVKLFCRKGRRRAPPTDDLLLYVIAAAILKKRRFILDKCRSIDDILRECNGMSGNLDVWALLDDARDLIASLHRKFPV